MNPELVKFHLPTTDQFSVAVDKILGTRSASQPAKASGSVRELCLPGSSRDPLDESGRSDVQILEVIPV
jgi:hypothetical protein